MDSKKFLIGTLVGGITHFFLGYLFYGFLLEGFFASNAGSATGVARSPESMIWWALIIGSLAFAALLSYVFLKWANISTFKKGLTGGAAIGFFISVAFDLIMYATSNLMNLTAVGVDIVVGTLMSAIIGGVIGAVLRPKPHHQAAAA
jgi:uncharacterized membrane protein